MTKKCTFASQVSVETAVHPPRFGSATSVCLAVSVRGAHDVWARGCSSPRRPASSRPTRGRSTSPTWEWIGRPFYRKLLWVWVQKTTGTWRHSSGIALATSDVFCVVLSSRTSELPLIFQLMMIILIFSMIVIQTYNLCLCVAVQSDSTQLCLSDWSADQKPERRAPPLHFVRLCRHCARWTTRSTSSRCIGTSALNSIDSPTKDLDGISPV